MTPHSIFPVHISRGREVILSVCFVSPGAGVPKITRPWYLVSYIFQSVDVGVPLSCSWLGVQEGRVPMSKGLIGFHPSGVLQSDLRRRYPSSPVTTTHLARHTMGRIQYDLGLVIYFHLTLWGLYGGARPVALVMCGLFVELQLTALSALTPTQAYWGGLDRNYTGNPLTCTVCLLHFQPRGHSYLHL